MLHNFPDDDLEFLEERVVYCLHTIFKRKRDLLSRPVIEVSAGLEEIIFSLTSQKFSNVSNATQGRDFILQYKDNAEKFLGIVDSKELDWKKVFSEHEKEPLRIYNLLVSDDKPKKSFAPKKPRNQDENSVKPKKIATEAKPKQPPQPRKQKTKKIAEPIPELPLSPQPSDTDFPIMDISEAQEDFLDDDGLFNFSGTEDSFIDFNEVQLNNYDAWQMGK